MLGAIGDMSFSLGESALSAMSSMPSMSTEMFTTAMPMSQPRGLQNFIKEIRNSKSKDEERSRVDKELGNIRQKFAQSSNLTPYHKKKYVWKMCYIYMLGYEVDFGHMEFISLLSASKYQEKSVGYMAIALFLKPGDELMTLVINSIRNDIIGRLSFGQTLALSAVSNIGGADLAEALSADVQKLILLPLDPLSSNLYNQSQNNPNGPKIDFEVEIRDRSSVSKKAALCLLRLYRTNPDCLAVSEWTDKIGRLLQDRDLGIVTSVMGFVLGLTAPSDNTLIMSAVIPNVLTILTRLTVSKACGDQYLYYRTPSPWLQVKCLKFLQYFEMPEKQNRDVLTDILLYILTHTESSESVNKTNADYSILYEAITLIISYGPDAGEKLRIPALAFLGKFLSTHEPNVRYIGLDIMNYILKHEGPEAVKVYKNNVLESLKDTDVSVRKRALENIFSLTDEENVHEVIDELLLILTTSDSAIKEDFVVKIAILTEKYYDQDLKWYIDVMIKMLLIAGDHVAEAIWHRIVLIITNHSEIHEYAAEKLYDCVKSKWSHDIVIALSGYLLGEIGVNICEKPEMSGYEQFAALHQHFHLSTMKTQTILLTAYVKLMNLYPDTKEVILEVFTKHSTSLQLELQQRACEYLKMPTIDPEIMEQVLNPMPMYSAEKENTLLSLNEPQGEKAEKSGWNVRASTSDSAVDQQDNEVEGVEENDGDDSVGNETRQMNMDLLNLDHDNDGVSPNVAIVGSGSAATSPKTTTKSSSLSTTINSDEQSEVNGYLLAAILAEPKEKCLLYENATVKLSIASEFRAHRGRLSFYVYNKSNYDMSRCQAIISQITELRFTNQAIPSDITSGEEFAMQITVECMKPFKESSTIEIQFNLENNNHSYTLKLPIILASFFEPVPSDKPTYMNRWKALENEVQDIFLSSKTLNTEYLLYIRNTIFLRFKIGLATDLDPTEKTATGTFSFHTGSVNPDGNLISIGGMLRLEGDPNQGRFRITVRSKNMLVSETVRDILKEFLM